MQKAKRFFLSRKTVFSLICGVGISCLIGTTIPQVTGKPPQFFETWKAESPKIYYLVDLLQLNQVYTSAWFLTLVALITSSLAFSIYYQSKVLVKSRVPDQREITEGSFKNFLSLRLVQRSGVRVEWLAREIKRVFMAGGYRFCPDTEGSNYFIFHKNRWSRWGSVIFHVGLLFVVMAALYTLAFQKRGSIRLVETGTFQGKNDDWHLKSQGVFAGDFDLGFQVYFNKFVPTYWENDQVKNFESSLTLIDEKGRARECSVLLGDPILFKGTEIYQATYYGYALGFILKKEDGKKVSRYFLLDAPAKKDEPFTGKMRFPATDYVLDMKFHPNLIEPSFYATFPGVHLTVTEKGEERFKGKVLLTQMARLGKDSLTFVQVHYWTGLTFVKKYGMLLLYCGFASGTLGALLIFMFPYKQVYLKVAEEGDHIELCMGGRTKRYQAIFSEEFKEIGERLEKGLGEHGNH